MELKSRILEVSKNAFFQRGLKSVTMDDIAGALGVSKKTIYTEFKNKTEIVYNVVQLFLEEDEKACNISMNDSKNAIDEILKLIDIFKQSTGLINPVFMIDAFKYYPNSWKLYEDYKDRFFTQKIKENLIRGIQEGLYRKDLNVEIMARLKLSTIDSTIDGKTFPISEFNFVEVGTEIMVHFLHGVCSLKGHSLINKYLKINE